MKIQFQVFFNFRIYISMSMTVVFVNADEIHGSWVGNIEAGSPFHRKKKQHGFWDSGEDFPWFQSKKNIQNSHISAGKTMDSGEDVAPVLYSKLLELPRMAETYRMITGDFSGQWSEEQRLIQVDPDSADWPIFSSN